MKSSYVFLSSSGAGDDDDVEQLSLTLTLASVSFSFFLYPPQLFSFFCNCSLFSFPFYRVAILNAPNNAKTSSKAIHVKVEPFSNWRKRKGLFQKEKTNQNQFIRRHHSNILLTTHTVFALNAKPLIT